MIVDWRSLCFRVGIPEAAIQQHGRNGQEGEWCTLSAGRHSACVITGPQRLTAGPLVVHTSDPVDGLRHAFGLLTERLMGDLLSAHGGLVLLGRAPRLDLATVGPPPKSWRFTVPGSPKTKRGAAPGHVGQMHANAKTVAYEQTVAGAAIDAGLAAGKGPCEVKIEIVLPTRHWKDADRVTSAVFDGMKRAGKAALYDDNLCIVQRTVVELVAVDPLCPSVTVTVTMLERDRSQPRERSETAAALSRSHMAATDFPESP